MKPTRSLAKKKVLAALAAAVAVAGAATPLLLLDRAGAGEAPPEPPWSFPSVTAQRQVGEPWSSGEDLARPVALMYVNDTCIHCKAELRLWESLAAEIGPRELRIVASPSSDTNDASWVPPSLRGDVLKDADGSVAEALSVSAVPVTFWIDTTDTVRLVHVGRSTRQRLTESIQAIGMRPAGAGDDAP